MQKIFTFLFVLLSAVASFSQVVVTATAGTTAPTTYTTLKAAFDAVNNGTHQGTVGMTVSGTVTETGTAVLYPSGQGGAAYSGMAIKPLAGSTATITGNLAAPLIDLNGADNVTIDGVNGTGSALTIINTSTANTPDVSTLRYINDASNNFLQNTMLLGSSTTGTAGIIFFSTAAAGGTGNDNNFISNCTISAAGENCAVNALYAAGSGIAGQENSSNTVANNSIADYFHSDLSTAGVLLAAGNTDWIISANKFFQRAPRVFTTGVPHRAIQIIGGNNYRINNNSIGFATASSTGTYTLGGAVTSRFLAIDLQVGSAVASSVQNNTISNFSFTTSSPASSATGIWCAINISAGNVNVGTETGNKIGSTSGTGNISILPTVAGTLTVPITSSSTGIVTIANNQVGGIDVLPTGVLSGNLLGIQAQGLSGSININNNTIGNGSPGNMRVGVIGTTTGNGIIRGILNANAGTISIAGNIVQNMVHNSSNALALFRGIEVQQGAASVTGNVITNLSANGTSTSLSIHEGVGILLSSDVAGAVLDDNTISNLSVVNTGGASGTVLSGIFLFGTVNGPTLSRNKIYGLSNASLSTSITSPGVVCGIYCRDANTASPLTIVNNMISLGTNQATNTAMIGIWNQVSTAANFLQKVYYNTVTVEGTATLGAQPSFCYYRGNFTSTAFTTPSLDIKNNIFTNNRKGGTGKHFAISNSYPAVTSSSTGWPANASDYNILNASPSTIGYWSGDQTFAGWQLSSACDVHSLSAVAVDYVKAETDLHLLPATNAAIDNKGLAIAGFTTDIDNETRSTITPDMGADEFISGPLALTVEYFKGKVVNGQHLLNWKASCTSGYVTFSIERSMNGMDFVAIESIVATRARCALPFDFLYAKPLNGKNYYRLKMTEVDGKAVYSSIISLLNTRKSLEITRFTPTIVQAEESSLTVYSMLHTPAVVVISGTEGRIILRQNITLQEGTNQVRIGLKNVPAGIFQLSVYSTGARAETIRFIKK